MTLMRFLTSCTSSMAFSFDEPLVCMETGKKMRIPSKVPHLAHLLAAAWSAAAPACMAVMNVWVRIHVRHRHVPGWGCASFPGDQCCSIWSFAIVHESHWLLHCRNLSSFHYPSNHVIYLIAAQSRCIFGMLDHVTHEHQQFFNILMQARHSQYLTEWSYDGLVRQFESNRREWYCMQPVFRMWWCCQQKSCFVNFRLCSGDDFGFKVAHNKAIPNLLNVL